MLVELCQKGQVTIPREIIVKLGLDEGDKLDIFEKDGSICIMPAVVYPKKYMSVYLNYGTRKKTKLILFLVQTMGVNMTGKVLSGFYERKNRLICRREKWGNG